MFKPLLTLIVLASFFGLKSIAQSPFITTQNHQFILNGKPYYFVSANYWYGGYLGLEKDKKRGIERLRKELDFLKSQGVTNLRVLTGAEGSGMINGVVRVGPSLQPEQGVFNEEILKGLDLLLVEMGKRNMKAVLYLSNNWEWSGGFQQYLIWNGRVPDSLKTRKLNWDEQRDIVSKFYGCEPCKEAYNVQAKLIIGRVNTYTKKKYTEDPTIMAWELANEPRPMRPSANDEYQKWISATAAFIKSLDKNHLVTTGHEGEQGAESMDLFEANHADKNIDYMTVHIWPKNWGWFADTAIQKDLSKVIEKSESYIQKHIPVATRLKKPLVIEEFGLPRDRHSFDPKSPTTSRDRYYDRIFSMWQKSALDRGVIAGVGIWSFGGTARPILGQVFWKKGDELMGDPPMEEQGLNSVFDSDKSTWKLIRTFANSIN